MWENNAWHEKDDLLQIRTLPKHIAVHSDQYISIVCWSVIYTFYVVVFFLQNYITSIESNETNLASALGKLCYKNCYNSDSRTTWMLCLIKCDGLVILFDNTLKHEVRVKCCVRNHLLCTVCSKCERLFSMLPECNFSDMLRIVYPVTSQKHLCQFVT